MKTIIYLFLVILFITSCKGHFFYENLYARANRKERLFLEKYELPDSICIQDVKVSHFVELPGIKGAITGSKISFDQVLIEHTLMEMYSIKLSPLISGKKGDFFLSQDCNFNYCFTNPFFELNDQNAFCDNVIVSELNIISQSGMRFEGGGGMSLPEDAGDDRHLLQFKLITSIYQNDTLIYKDNRAYWNRVISERGQRLVYEVPREILDSLVSLTLEEYFMRVK